MNAEDVYLKLNERVKELSCLYELSKLLSDIDVGLDENVNNVLNVIPKGWQEPRELKVSIKIDQLLFGSEIAENKGQSADIIVENKVRGTITVAYSKGREQEHGYLMEEQQLLNQIAREIGGYFTRLEQKEKERLVQEQLKKEDRLNILAELTAGVAHELNTPLGNIMGYAELLKKSITNRAQQHDLEKIIKSAINAREIVKKLMYFSCEMPTQFNYVRVDQIIKSTVDLLKLRLREKQIKIDCKEVKAVNGVRGDELQLSQVFINLIMNAISASSVKGEVFIATKIEESDLIIQLKDFGEGIKTEDLNKIFQPFFTTQKGGTGLGLPVVHGIIQNHGGQINVESKIGVGTAFTIKLPIENKINGK